MYKPSEQSMFDTVEGYENFVNHLLENETELSVNPLLDWEDALTDNHFLFQSGE